MASLERRGRSALIAAICLMLLPIHTLPLLAEELRSESRPKETPVTTEVTPKEAKDAEAVGIASYYAKRYDGRKTTSGARYNPEKMTAAHQALPFGTKVKVTNLSNGKEVVVTVNDRCRKRKKPFIDLSRAAARELGFLGNGIAKVKIVPLAEEASLK
ncbi:rare lipoprotein A-like double-psi beta-barrel domain protein [Geotalea daltonii FRC-32]|uniref:Probable endolytic peptidoglycan transglycosylase RlpA n=1 Tax=Geotalea daltonii (strain DSM 22248 / JCM 15807 / FRC-32) TaxID=316067 RepID=B9M1W7_GEODF|nr:septal ring lytic transglycosylase RlpA family protein [Geotalea daltonii]ACM19263.1 rare lipoprotein A-like double-psi beta-barrel domain protein [Geotalea daltonii FRC-32]